MITSLSSNALAAIYRRFYYYSISQTAEWANPVIESRRAADTVKLWRLGGVSTLGGIRRQWVWGWKVVQPDTLSCFDAYR